MGAAVKSEYEYRMEQCMHLLVRVDPAKEHGFRWHCIRPNCGKWLYNKSGVEVPEADVPAVLAKLPKWDGR